MWLYQVLDILGTLLETIGIYVSVKAYCPNIKKKFANFIPLFLFFATVYFWTWFVEDTTFKMTVILILTFLAYKIITKEASINIIAGLMTQQVYLIAANALAETISYHVLIDMTVTLDDRQFLKPQVYLLYFLFQIIFMLFFYFFMKRHSGGIDKNSLLAISIPFFIIEISFTYIVRLSLNSEKAYRFNWYIELGVIIVAMLFVVLLVYIKNYLHLREQEQQKQITIERMSRQFDYYQAKLKDEEKVRSLYHDMKNHLLVLQGKIASPETAAMVEKLQSQVAMYEDYVHTGNDILDIILKEKSELARERNIALSITADLNNIDFIEPLDISTIFGNGLDNAIEASEKLSEGERAILVKAVKVQKFFSVLIENNCSQESMNAKSRTAKQDKFFHGFGISNMRKTAEKYGGQLTTKCENGKFTLKILIPIP